jgi:SPP1 family predicted phage head-tail adaptor
MIFKSFTGAAGNLNQRIQLQQPSTAQDATGEPLTTWSDVAAVWAHVQDISGRQYVAAGGVQNAVQTQITIRYRTGLAPAMRVLHNGSTYRIEAILGQDKRFLTLMCERSAA